MRVSAHLDNALAAYEAGSIERALVSASRPMVELLPRISRDLWRDDDLGRALNHAAAAVASEIRKRGPSTAVRRARDNYDDLSARAVGTVVGDAAADPAYRASVVVALLRTTAAAYDEALQRSDERAQAMHEDAAALVGRARALATTLWGGAISSEGMEASFDELTAVMAGAEASGERVKELAGVIAGILHAERGALVEQDLGPSDHLVAAGRLLRDCVEAYRAGEYFRADKLAARAYVEEYAVAREDLPEADPATLAALDDLLGRRVRRAIAARAPHQDISKLTDEAAALLADLHG